jgi:hypothetical protein
MASPKFELLEKVIDRELDPDDIMAEIMTIYDDITLIPDVGKTYTFIYRAKTPNIIYDEFPLVAVTSIEKWGFKGLNYHWGGWRQYTWVEMMSQCHYIPQEDVGELNAIPYRNFKVSL